MKPRKKVPKKACPPCLVLKVFRGGTQGTKSSPGRVLTKKKGPSSQCSGGLSAESTKNRLDELAKGVVWSDVKKWPQRKIGGGDEPMCGACPLQNLTGERGTQVYECAT